MSESGFSWVLSLMWLLSTVKAEGHNTFASGDSCFCVAKVAPVAHYSIPDSVNCLSDKRYWCVRLSHQIGPLSRTEQKSL